MSSYETRITVTSQCQFGWFEKDFETPDLSLNLPSVAAGVSPPGIPVPWSQYAIRDS